ncbi:sel1 repeat family protein [Vreelandella andesensis]|uniref:Sel1 repeat family protein n=1 Tax=Vreelandella andesensis TaxID=447567 RepID=A0A3S0YYM6_9GAMM|nr:tetratricopeptide repeat protein [Halomonas andesensis]RUR32732.1 sel1 repeat family protein [Halomonas andesensis]
MKKLSKANLVTWITALLAFPAFGQSFEVGLEAASSGDYATVLENWRPLAEQGDTVTQYNLGIMYARGESVIQSYTEAATWYCLSAEHGYANAQYNLRVMYARGQGVIQNYTETAYWYRLAAAQGDAGAQNNLGNKYFGG